MSARTHTGRRLGAYVASGALVISGAVSGAVLAVSPAQAVTYDPAPANQGADWLQGELTNGLIPTQYAAPYDVDFGLSADVASALKDIGGHQSTVESISDAVAARIGDYIGTGGSTSSGATAKASVLAQTAGDSATSFGGVNLIQRLESTVSSTTPIAGRLVDQSPFGDFANSLGQSFAARALSAAGSPKAGAVTDFLLDQQCSSGYFRLDFTPSKTAAGQSCVDGTDAPNPDVTANAVIQLASQASDPDVAEAITRAKTWLRGQQRCDGSYGGGPSTEGSNANSTGLVAWALGDSSTSRQAAQWLRAHQATSADAGNSLAGEIGAIAYDDAGLAKGRAKGITAASSDQFRRATAQAAPGVRWFSSDPTPAIALTAPTGYFKQGSRVVLRTTGAAEGTVLCVSGTGTPLRGFATASGLSTTVTLPTGTRSRVYTVKDVFGHRDTGVVKVLGARTLAVTRTPGEVKRNATVTVAARGLAAGEAAKIYYGTRLVKSGPASAAGNLVARFSAGSSLGTKSIRAYGRFSDIRKGATTVKVVR